MGVPGVFANIIKKYKNKYFSKNKIVLKKKI